MSAQNSPSAPVSDTQPSRQSQGPRQQSVDTSIDKVETIIAIVLGPLGCLFGSFFGAISVMATDSCLDNCNDVAVSSGILVMIFAPWIVWIASSIWAIARVVRRKRGAAIMTGGLITSVVLYVSGYLILTAGLP